MAWVAPVLVSKVDSDIAKAQGGLGEVVDKVSDTTPLIAVRVPVAPELENDR